MRNHVVNSTRWQFFIGYFLTTFEAITSNTYEECESQNLSCYSMDLSRIEWGKKKERLWQVLLRKFLPLSFTFSSRSLALSSHHSSVAGSTSKLCASSSVAHAPFFFKKSSERVELFETFGPISILSSVSWDTSHLFTVKSSLSWDFPSFHSLSSSSFIWFIV